MFDSWMTDPTVVSTFDPALQDVLGNISDISDMVDDIVASTDFQPADPGDAPAPLGPSVDLLPAPTLPDPTFMPGMLDPGDFALNGFPHWWADPTTPVYYSPFPY